MTVFVYEEESGAKRNDHRLAACRSRRWVIGAHPSDHGPFHLSFLVHSTSLAQAGWWTIVGAVLSAPLTIATGVISRLRLPMQEGEARSFLRAHMALGLIVLGLLIVMALWRAWLWQTDNPVTVAYLAVLIVVAVVMTVQGYLGGELVYRYGAEVKRGYRQLSGHRPNTAPPPLFPERRIKG
jgi:uncharacterized membrane protein